MAVKVIIWGAGKMGQLHAQIYEKIEGAKIAFVVEKDQEKARAFAERFRCRWAVDIEEIGPEEADGVDICLPTWLHREAVERAAGHFRGIFCEKPVCLEREEYAAIREAFKGKDTFGMVGQVLRFWNGYVKAKELVEAGRIGTPRMITCRRRQKMPDWSAGGWLMDQKRSGGILMDLNIHDVDYVYWLMGMPRSVSCEIVKRGETTLHSLITLAYDGCCASIVGAWGMPERFFGGGLEYSLEIVGDRGMLEYCGDEAVNLTTAQETERIALEPTDGYMQELVYFVDCIRNERVPERCSVESVKGTMEILWKAAQAEAQERIVSLNGSAAKG